MTEMPGEMVERVACALDERIIGGVTMTCGDLARVAIAAMREPSDAMVIAGAYAYLVDHPERVGLALHVWRAMIDTALEDRR